jgi:AcrR family transcriptional regulator
MPVMPPRRPSSRERILDAAAELVGEVGAGRLTLDAVADRAGLSKGGLLYNFPTKEALLEGMLERIVAVALREKEKLLHEFAGQRNAQARASVETALRTRCENLKGIASGMLAASAENPKLLDPVRPVIAREWKALKSGADDPDAAMLAWLAIEGLGSLEVHDLSPLSKADREAVIAAIRRLVERGIR